MKKLFIILVAVLITATVFLPRQASAQTPQKMSYQAVIRNSSDQLVTNQGIGMQVSILQTTATGTAVYVETHNTTTNANGLVSVEIGNGTVVSGDFATIDWATDVYFIKTETDPTTAGGTTYTITGTSQLLSVAYALHAKTAETITGTVNYTETDPIYTSSQANNITAQNITDLGNLSNTNTGDQDISGIAVNTQAIKDTASQIRADIPDVSGFVSTETDPIYTSSQANNITAQNITDLGNLSNTNTGDQDISGIAVNTQAIQDTASQIRADIPDVSGFVSTETDPVFTSSQANNITAQNITDLSNLSGTNTGDQDISGIAINTQAIQDTASQIRADIPDVSGFISTETDPVFTSSEANNITAQNITDLGNLSGVNTGDQDLSSYLTIEVDGSITNEIELPTTGNAGDMNYWNGTAWVIIPTTVNEGATLQMISGVPTWTGGTPLVVIGDYRDGGVVFYVDGTGQHGLVCAVSDQSTGAEWGCYGTTIAGADGTAIGTGTQNTIDIEAGCTTAGTAADLCANLALNSHSDWFLPSKDELNAMYDNKNAINTTATANGGVAFASAYYWSSTEANNYYARRQYFYHGHQSNDFKYATNYVRAIRAF